MSKVTHVNSVEQWNKIATFHDENDNILVCKFGSSWCGPCGALKPKFESLASHYDNNILFITIDIDECESIADKFSISSLPTTLIIKKSIVVKTIVGADIVGIKTGIDNIITIPSQYQ